MFIIGSLFTWEEKQKVGGKLYKIISQSGLERLEKGSCKGALNNGKRNKYPTKR
jgi:hypothetical protein